MTMEPLDLTKSLSDELRLRIVVLLAEHSELCVCDLMNAVAADQPKVSRHLAVLKKAGIVLARRDGQWMHYRLHPDLPHWAFSVITSLHHAASNKAPFTDDAARIRGLSCC
ncbi:metalloregulator ArsR/SmtB family transcription factor [Granulosicoccaceae sp. 1_MG-2023]|nr:metalloregulator ArsR/SmtB family transcription factor [Granulosicoccaceae sp. 1_MG-2023]